MVKAFFKFFVKVATISITVVILIIILSFVYVKIKNYHENYNEKVGIQKGATSHCKKVSIKELADSLKIYRKNDLESTKENVK